MRGSFAVSEPSAVARELQGGGPSPSLEQLARAEERRSLGQALHDGTGQLLALGLIQLGALSGRLAGGPEQRRVDELRGLLQQTLEEVRALSHGLRPPALSSLGLRAALAWLAACACTDELEVTLEAAAERARPSDEAALAIYRIAQSALGNVVLHAGARRCRIALSRAGAALLLEVSDDGVGFDPLNAASGLGLLGMRERAEEAGGELFVCSRPGRTMVRAVLPFR